MAEEPKILIVEDEAFIAMALEKNLIALGCKVVKIVSFGEAFLEAYLIHRPHLVLMDICLAGTMNGIEAARAVLAREPAKIAFMTAFGTEMLSEEIAAIPHVMYLLKPVTKDKLAELVDIVRADIAGRPG